MKNTLAALAAGVLTLALSACSNTQDAAELPATAAPTTTDMASGLHDLVLGETITVTRCGADVPCEVDITFTDATLTETCPYGVSYPDMEATDPEGTRYLTFEGEFHVVDADTGFLVSESDFTAVDPDQYATSSLTAFDCEDLKVDEQLSNPVDPGLKRAGHLILAIPENTETVRFTQFWGPATYEFDVTDLDVEPGAGERPLPASASTPPTDQQEAPAPAVTATEAAPASIWTEPGVGYQCSGTDAWTNDPANCTAANLGGDPSYDIHWGPGAAIPAGETGQDLSNIPFANGGTCPAYKCGYGTDAEGNDLNQEKADSHAWWGECIAINTTEYCRANDPWQQ